MKTLFSIAGVDVIENDDASLSYISGAMIDGDGSGSSHGDPDFQDDTTLHFQGKSLNADIDLYIVVPPQIILAVPGIVLGCKATVLNTLTNQFTSAVVGDVGPHSKIGEMSIATARAIGVAPSPTTGGEERHVIIYKIYPGIPAEVNGKIYTLQHY